MERLATSSLSSAAVCPATSLPQCPSLRKRTTTSTPKQARCLATPQTSCQGRDPTSSPLSAFAMRARTTSHASASSSNANVPLQSAIRWSSCHRRPSVLVAGAASNPHDSSSEEGGVVYRSMDPTKLTAYTLEHTRTLVETAMLAAVSGLAYLVSTILKLENSLGYFLPLPVVLAALRSGGAAGWRTMAATCFLLIVLLGPLRALSYMFLHGLLAATLGSLWRAKANFWFGVVAGALVRMAGQLSYLMLSSVAMNENMFAMLLSNVHNTLDQVAASLNMTGGPSPLAVSCMVFSLLLVNGLTYCFLVHVVYRVVLGTMGYQLGPLPGVVNKYLNAGVIQR